jgi:hypothetical protein
LTPQVSGLERSLLVRLATDFPLDGPAKDLQAHGQSAYEAVTRGVTVDADVDARLRALVTRFTAPRAERTHLASELVRMLAAAELGTTAKALGDRLQAAGDVAPHATVVESTAEMAALVDQPFFSRERTVDTPELMSFENNRLNDIARALRRYATRDEGPQAFFFDRANAFIVVEPETEANAHRPTAPVPEPDRKYSLEEQDQEILGALHAQAAKTGEPAEAVYEGMRFRVIPTGTEEIADGGGRFNDYAYRLRREARASGGAVAEHYGDANAVISAEPSGVSTEASATTAEADQEVLARLHDEALRTGSATESKDGIEWRVTIL